MTKLNILMIIAIVLWICIFTSFQSVLVQYSGAQSGPSSLEEQLKAAQDRVFNPGSGDGAFVSSPNSPEVVTEYESQSMIVLKTSSVGASLWEAIDSVKKKGYSLDEMTDISGNLYVIMTK